MDGRRGQLRARPQPCLPGTWARRHAAAHVVRRRHADGPPRAGPARQRRRPRRLLPRPFRRRRDRSRPWLRLSCRCLRRVDPAGPPRRHGGLGVAQRGPLGRGRDAHPGGRVVGRHGRRARPHPPELAGDQSGHRQRRRVDAPRRRRDGDPSPARSRRRRARRVEARRLGADGSASAAPHHRRRPLRRPGPPARRPDPAGRPPDDLRQPNRSTWRRGAAPPNTRSTSRRARPPWSGSTSRPKAARRGAADRSGAAPTVRPSSTGAC